MTEKKEIEITLRTINREIDFAKRISAGEGVKKVPLPHGLYDSLIYLRDYFEKCLRSLEKPKKKGRR